MVLLNGDRVVLRSVDSSDIDTLLLWENANNEPLYGVYEERYSREDVAQFVENQQRYSIAETEQLRLMICSHEGERLGCIDLTEYDGEKAFVSILIVESYNRRKGFAKNALRVAVEYAKSIGLQTLYAVVMPENIPSINLFQQAGFVKECGDRFVLSLR
ncbi:MAG: GNAT family N-acetyltransferase [Rikenellaceae bacterium]|nr:GNAT family N-acetyltransferase [Rikenellaceae bacterium]